ncbi:MULTISPECIES: DUF928 domain-containing protein [unclassified Leptolyngbya]|uniref:DUF928 domain-containing protein n=1 Tax=unclassified Leptolyngbya TaxID=2650499 RepID=UPI0016850640|nr:MULTISPECIES: DUF928 domain-containing protein [unclassified Leptolyngbya]MBD1913447.1 DUF928 domain-containing protein [Leptolyngbya sp. FACHB-8]MBD2155842.1 DUF928 domain-containing protein [Leptolyngbya sp. FACHB-16]
MNITQPRLLFTLFCSSGRFAVRFLLLLGLLLSAIPMPAEAQTFVPPNRGMPGRREGGGTRGCWGYNPNDPSRSGLVALVPAENFGYTLDEYPSFFVYVPKSFAEQAAAAEFDLMDADGESVYHASYRVSDRSGVLRIDLPKTANLAPLEVGKDYNWAFTLVCDADDASANLIVDSWIQRMEPSTQLQAELQATAPDQLPELLASRGIWYNTLASLANPEAGASHDNVSQLPNLLARWQTLLNSVGLTVLAEELVPDALLPLTSTAHPTGSEPALTAGH